jgi:hypothetical protein
MLNSRILKHRQELVPYARHEAGHLVIARREGFSTGSLKLAPRQASAAITLIPSIRTLEELVSYIERRVVVLYAGMLAEALHGAEISRQKAERLRASTAEDDYKKIRELVRCVAGVRKPDAASEQDFQTALDEAEMDLVGRSGDAVIANHKVIEKVAFRFIDALQEAGFPDSFELGEEQIDDILADQMIV